MMNFIIITCHSNVWMSFVVWPPCHYVIPCSSFQVNEGGVYVHGALFYAIRLYLFWASWCSEEGRGVQREVTLAPAPFATSDLAVNAS